MHGAQNDWVLTQLGQILAKERLKNQLPLLKSQEQKQGTLHAPLHATPPEGQKQGTLHAPLHATPPEGWANHLSHPSDSTCGHTLTLTPYKEQTAPSSGSEQASKEPNVYSSSPQL